MKPGSIVIKTGVTGWIGIVKTEEQYGYCDVLWAWDAAPSTIAVSQLQLIDEKRKAVWEKAFAEWETRPKKRKVASGTKAIPGGKRSKRA
jgi:hypothetical protein